MTTFPEPTEPLDDRRAVFLRYLDYLRDSVVQRVAALSDEEVRLTRLPSGWTPLELAHHLRHVERRWLEWGFQGRDVGDPWADRVGGRWQVPPGVGKAEILDALDAQGRHTAHVVGGHELADVGAPGPRWAGAPPPTMERVLFHLLQEYARHLGHLDVVCELAGGPVGE